LFFLTKVTKFAKIPKIFPAITSYDYVSTYLSPEAKSRTGFSGLDVRVGAVAGEALLAVVLPVQDEGAGVEERVLLPHGEGEAVRAVERVLGALVPVVHPVGVSEALKSIYLKKLSEKVVRKSCSKSCCGHYVRNSCSK
jgi:hypothetical protein